MARGPSTRAASGSQQSSQTSVSVAEPAAPADVITELTVDGSSTDYNVFTSQHPVVLVDFYSDA